MKLVVLAAFLVGACFANEEDGNGDDSKGRPHFAVPEDMHGDDADPTDNGDAESLVLLDAPPRKFGVSSSDESQIQLMQALDLCGSRNNLATRAIPSGSGGGTGTYGPAKMNDQRDCTYYWPGGIPGTSVGGAPSIQYAWTEPHLINHFVIRTDRYCSASGLCTTHADGRGIASGTVQYHNGFRWVTHGSFANTSTTNIYYFFKNCISTTGIRVINLTTHPCGPTTSPVVYEWSVCECDLKACGAHTNLAPFATPYASAGGAAGGAYSVSNLNDLQQCLWFWTSGNDGWIMYYWEKPVYVEQIRIYTDRPCIANPECADAIANIGRGVGSGTVQYSKPGVGWVTDGTFTSSSEIISYQLSSCVETTRLRILHLKAHNCTGGFGTSPIIYDWQVCSC